MNRDLMRQAQQLQARMAKMQEELGNEIVEGTAGGGVVTVVVNGHQVIQSVKIQPEAVDPADVEMLEDLVLAATNEALDRARNLASSRMGGDTYVHPQPSTTMAIAAHLPTRVIRANAMPARVRAPGGTAVAVLG